MLERPDFEKSLTPKQRFKIRLNRIVENLQIDGLKPSYKQVKKILRRFFKK